uniref:Putative eukaryotic translation initiation factor 3 subunit 8 n=1 Tax=Trypanosoma congolense (strain IL3000) TaxID=1068625 RepID=G0UX25_TRYCI|nr:putative eukaryotic translation initiation factor 3 subunit 8 [Trypanosoma congolense IL3000]
MASFFDQSDSDESIDEVLHDDQVEKNVAQIDPKWFEVTDDEDIEERQVVLSRHEKSLNEIQTACDLFDYNVGHGFWHEAEEVFKDILKKSAAHKKKYDTAPWPLLECLQNIPDLNKDSEVLGSDAETTESVSEEINSDKTEKLNRKSLKRLIEAVKEATDRYKQDIERLHDEEVEDEETEEELTEEKIVERLKNSVLLKGKKVPTYTRLADKCKKGGYTALRITSLGIVADAHLEDYGLLPHTTTAAWMKSFDTLNKCYDLLVENPAISVNKDFSDSLGKKHAVIRGGLCGLLKRLSVHLRQIAQFKNVVTPEYIEIVYLENRLVDLADAIFGYPKQTKRDRAVCCDILISILGSRRQEAHNILYPMMPSVSHNVVTSSVMKTVQLLYDETKSVGSEESIPHALFNLVYQMGLEGSYREGRDLIFRSGVVEKLGKSIELSILFNRAIAQLGLASFMKGDILQAYNLLSSLWSNRARDVLIGQKLPDGAKESEENELKYRDLLLPPHTHIPHGQLELATMLSTLVVDTVKEAKKPYEGSRHQSYFYRVINQMSYQPLHGEPIEFREQITAAYDALKLGDYSCSSTIIANMSAWQIMQNGSEALKAFLKHLKEAALRIFCYNNRCNFATISVEMMAKRYEMSESEVKCIINDIISENNSPLIAFWDREDKYLHVDRSNTSRLQYLVEGTASSVVEVAQYTEKRVRDNDFRGGRGRGHGRGRGGR